jgi:hypothetical protein
VRSLLFSTTSSARMTVRVLLGALATLTLVLIGFEAAAQVLALSQSMLARRDANGLNVGLVGTCLTIIGALMMFVGACASLFLRNRTDEPQWLLYVYACPLLAAGFFLLMHWFAVCGATSLQR